MGKLLSRQRSYNESMPYFGPWTIQNWVSVSSDCNIKVVIYTQLEKLSSDNCNDNTMKDLGIYLSLLPRMMFPFPNTASCSVSQLEACVSYSITWLLYPVAPSKNESLIYFES